MIVCACAARNDEYIEKFVRQYLQGIKTVTDLVLVDMRMKLNQEGVDQVGCGTCIGAIRTIVFAVVKTLPYEVKIHESARRPQEEVRKLYKQIAIKVIS